MAGFVKFYRETLDHPVVHKDNDYYVVWSYLLLNANFEEGVTEFNGQLFTVKPGQMIRGRKQISEKCKVNESKTERILKRFEIEQMIEQQTSKRKRLITILNWKDYQITEQQNEQLNEQQVNNKRTTNEQQLNTNKNNKEVLRSIKNNKNKDNIKPLVKNDQEHWFDTFWKIYPKKVNRAGALKSFFKKVSSENVLNKIISDLTIKTNSFDWKKDSGQFIPHATTYLNQERWNDVVDIKTENISEPLFPLEEIEKMKQDLAAIGFSKEEVNENE